MKETIKVNLNGLLFDLDSDAYQELKKYLDSLEAKFSNSPDEAGEILEDIEARIAEIFVQRTDKGSKIVNLALVEEVIQILGTANDMDESDIENPSENRNTSNKQSHNTYQRSRRLYRDPDNSILGGVSSGLAAYFSIDPLWIRVAFIALCFAKGLGFIVYAIMWVIVPFARTTAQKLEMTGQPVNISNIEQQVRDEFGKVKSTMKDIPNSKAYKNTEDGFRQFFQVLGNVILIIIKVVFGIAAGALLLGLVFTIIGVTVGGAAFFPMHAFDWFHWPNSWVLPQLTILSLCIILLIVIPLVMLLVRMIRWIFDIKPQNHFGAVAAATVWFIAFVSIMAILIFGIDKGQIRTANEELYILNIEEDTPLQISVNNFDYDDIDMEQYHIFGYSFIWDDFDDEFYRRPELQIVKTNSKDVNFILHKEYLNIRIDDHFSSSIIDYDWRHSHNTLSIDNYFSCDDEDAWYFPYTIVVLELPVGHEIQLDHEAVNMLNNTPLADHSEYYKLANKTLVMTNYGLRVK